MAHSVYYNDLAPEMDSVGIPGTSTSMFDGHNGKICALYT